MRINVARKSNETKNAKIHTKLMVCSEGNHTHKEKTENENENENRWLNIGFDISTDSTGVYKMCRKYYQTIAK